MENLSLLQQQIQQKREAYDQAHQAYYSALQAWSLAQRGVVTGTAPPPTPEAVEALRAQRRQAQQALQADIQALCQVAAPPQLLEQVPAALPFLLLPVRVEARYVTLRHVVRRLKSEDALDVSAIPRLAARLQQLGFEKDEEGVVSYQVPALHLTGLNFGFGFGGRRRRSEDLPDLETPKPPSGNYIRRKNDDRELRIRLYPDDIFLEGMERALQPEEWQAGRQYWEQVGGGRDVRQAWRQLAAAGTPARGAWIVRATRPTNFVDGQPPPAKPVFDDPGPLKDGAYTLPPVSRLLPERFTVRLFKNGAFKDFTGQVIPEPLVLGLDPTHDPFDTSPESGMAGAGTGLQTPDYLRWIHDFEAAEAAGLGIRIDLSQHPEYRDGVDKILVVGAKLSADARESARLWQAQLQNHLYKEDGMGIVAPGTPTNNFEQQKSGYNQREQEADRYFASEWEPPAAGGLETDESRLKKALGLAAQFRLPGGQGTDVSEAALMNELLWPATWGYYLLQFFSPALNEATREKARRFFLGHVRGRGSLPVLRINRQPYGIAPVTSWSHWQYGPEPLAEEEQFAASLWSLFLSKLYPRWQALAGQVKTVNTVGGRGLDNAFIEMLGVSPSAAHLHRGWVAGVGFQEVMRAAQADPAAATGLASDTAFQPAAFERELAQMGLLADFFRPVVSAYQSARQQVRRILIDGLPLAEDRPLERLAGKGWNYLEWLAQAPVLEIWNHDFSSAPAGDGAADSSAAVSALAVLTRQAVLRAYLEAGLQLAEPHPGLWLLRVKDFEAQHLHLSTLPVDPAALVPENKLHQAFTQIIRLHKISQPFELEPDRRLYFTRAYPATGARPLADWLGAEKQNPALPWLPGVMRALHYFSQVPTRRLARLFTEHLDLCSHRLDAWLGGLVGQRLEKQRAAAPQGLYLGAFGYLLGLQPNPDGGVVLVEEEAEYLPAGEPEPAALAAIPLVHAAAARRQGIDPAGPGWDRAFFYIGDTPGPGARLNTATGRLEPGTQLNVAHSDGFIHAPSTAHATAAAILRAGFLNHQADNQTALVALQLNSPRVRQALQLLEGMQQGAPLGELLGFYFERLLHENQLDAFLFNLRAAFPLPRTESAGSSPSPMTATDGLALLTSRRTGRQQNPANPTDWLHIVPGITPTDTITKNRIDAQAQVLEDYLDALGDLLLAESVYQTARGNKDRAAAALRILNSGGQVVVPEWVRTPLNGSALTHRVGVVFQAQASGTATAGWTPAGSPRSRLSPALNAWLRLRLPPPEQIAVALQLPDGRREKITLAELAIEPLDLVYALPASLAGAEASAFGLYVQVAAQQKFGAELPAEAPALALDLKDRSGLEPAELSLLELSSLLAALRKTVQECRPLSANDFLLPDQAAAGADSTDATGLEAALREHLTTNPQAAALIQALRDQGAALEAAIRQGQPPAVVQPLVRALLAAVLGAWQQGMDLSGEVAVSAAEPAAVSRLAQRALAVATELEQGLARARQSLAGLDPALPGAARYQALQQAAGLLFRSTLPLFADVKLESPAQVQACYQGRDLIENTGPEALDSWMQEAALVRKPLRAYRHAVLLSELLAPPETERSLAVLQFPFFEGIRQPWIGGLVPAATPAAQRASLSLLLDLPATFAPEASFSGLVIDEWPEWIPEQMVDTGVAFQYNQPNTEPPQTMLLAVAPVEAGNWQWEHLVGAVNDALEMSRMRLVSPAHLHESSPGLSQVLPAILLPFMPENQHTPVVEPL